MRRLLNPETGALIARLHRTLRPERDRASLVREPTLGKVPIRHLRCGILPTACSLRSPNTASGPGSRARHSDRSASSSLAISRAWSPQAAVPEARFRDTADINPPPITVL